MQGRMRKRKAVPMFEKFLNEKEEEVAKVCALRTN